MVLLPGPSRGDTLHFTNGARLSGIVVRAEGGYVLETPSGWLKFDEAVVDRVETGDLPLKTFRRRFDQLDPADLKACTALVAFCEAHGLIREKRQVQETLLAHHPDHASTRTDLGYLRISGTWLTRDEARRRLGLVPVEGGWATPEISGRVERQADDIASLAHRLERLETVHREEARRVRSSIEDEEASRRELRQNLAEARDEIRRLTEELERTRKSRPPLVSLSPPIVFDRHGRRTVFPPPLEGPLITPNPNARRPFSP